MILDTQYLGALADGNAAAREKAAELDEEVVPTRIPTAVIWEVFIGIGNAPFEEHGNELRALYEKLIASRSTVALTPKVAVARAN